MKTRRIGPLEVSEIGLGCMSLSHAYGPPPDRATAEQVLLGALDAGYTFFDTAAVYGLGHNERLVGEVLGPRRGDIVLVHWTRETNYPLSGDEAVEQFIGAMGESAILVRRDRYPSFRLDVLTGR